MFPRAFYIQRQKSVIQGVVFKSGVVVIHYPDGTVKKLKDFDILRGKIKGTLIWSEK